MNIDGQRLRLRRLQLGLTTRGLAREVHVSRTLIKRLEDTGDGSTINCGTLQHILDALSLDLIDLQLRQADTNVSDAPTIELLGAILTRRTRGIAPSALAQLAGLDPSTLKDHLGVLEQTLRPAGLRLRRGSTGIRLVPASTIDPPPATGARGMDAPTDTDLRMLYRAHQGRLHTGEVWTMRNGNVSLHRLMNARLADTGDGGEIVVGPMAPEALQLDARPTPAHIAGTDGSESNEHARLLVPEDQIENRV